MAPLRIGRSRLPYWRKVRKKTQTDIANYLGVSQPYISKIEKGTEKFSFEMAANAAEYLGINVMELYEWEIVHPKSKRL